MEEDEDVPIHVGPASTNFIQPLQRVNKNVPSNLSKQLLPKDSIDKDVWEEIRLILNESLLFEEDMEQIQGVLSHFDVQNDHIIRNMFRGTNSFLVFLLGMILYLYVGSYAFVIVSIFYAYRTSNYLWQKHTRQKQIKRLLAAIKNNFNFLRKVIKFLYENENLLKTRFGSNEGSTARTNLQDLKEAFIKVQQDINRVYSDATMRLLRDVPLVYNMETHYICLNEENLKMQGSVSQLHNMHMLLQSQFLSRLILSLAPCMLENPEFLPLSRVIIRVIYGLKDTQSKLLAKFKYPMLNGISMGPQKFTAPLPNKTRKEIATESLAKNIHCVSNSLQYSLIRSRELEDRLESEQSVDDEHVLNEIQGELQACNTFVSNLLLKRKHVHDTIPERTQSEVVSAAEEAMDVGFSTLDPQVEDDVFEATINEGEDLGVAPFYEDEDFDPLVKRKRNEMLGELKGRIKAQAEDWARREKMVRMRKGLPEPDSESAESSEAEKPLERSKNRRGFVEWYGSSDEEEMQDDCNGEKPRTGRGFPCQNSLIADAIRQNQRFNTFLEEENFSASGENSEENSDEN